MFKKPNTVPTPNDFFMLKDITPTEFRVIAHVIYKTYGFWKQWDWISLGQFVKDCGLSRQGAVNALNEMVKQGYLWRKRICPKCKTEITGGDQRLCNYCKRRVNPKSYYSLAVDEELQEHLDGIGKREMNHELDVARQACLGVHPVDTSVNSVDTLGVHSVDTQEIILTGNNQQEISSASSSVNSLGKVNKKDDNDNNEKENFGSDFKTINNPGPQQKTNNKAVNAPNQTPPKEVGNEYFLTIEQLLDKKNINVPLTYKNFAIVRKMYEDGVPLELVVRTITEVMSRAKGKKINSFKYFEDAIWENFNRRKSNDNSSELTVKLLIDRTKNRGNVDNDKRTPQTLEEAINKKGKVT